jgi:hypothetical protein
MIVSDGDEDTYTHARTKQCVSVRQLDLSQRYAYVLTFYLEVCNFNVKFTFVNSLRSRSVTEEKNKKIKRAGILPCD